MRNRKSRQAVALDDNSQDAMIKMVDLANYIHDPKVQTQMNTHRNQNKNKDLEDNSLEVNKKVFIS